MLLVANSYDGTMLVVSCDIVVASWLLTTASVILFQ